MRRQVIKMMVIVLSVFTGSFLLGIAASGDKPEGKPFDALWRAIDDLYGQAYAWYISDSNMWSAVSGNVGIGTNGPAHKKFEVVGDSMYTNPDNNTYFFIEQGQENTPIPIDGKRIGAYDEEGGAWKTLGVDGSPLVLNGRSGGLIHVNGPINLHPITEPDPPDDGFVLYVDEADGYLKAKSSSNAVTMLARGQPMQYSGRMEINGGVGF